MRTYDLSPLFRSTVGFDRMTRLLDSALQQSEQASTYPPYNIQKLGEMSYRITMAVAGFSQDELEIESKESQLTVRGKAAQDDQQEGTFLYRGIAGRAFERTFQLADHIRVQGASLENGLLHIELVREIPEAMKPRKIEITGGTAQAAQLEQRQAA